MRHVRAMLVAALLSLLLPLGALALAEPVVPAIEMGRSLELTVDFQQFEKPVPGVTFDLYRVGDVDAQGSVQLVGGLGSTYAVTSLVDQSGWSKVACTMYAELEAKGASPLCSAVTGADGTAAFQPAGGLTAGLYLMAGHEATIVGKTYVTYPFLLSLPMWDTETGDWSYVVCVSPKYGEKTTPTPTPTNKPTGSRTTNGNGNKPATLLSKTGDILINIWPHIVLGLSLVYMGLRLRKSDEE